MYLNGDILLDEILSSMREDSVKQLVAGDRLLKSLALYMLTSKGKTGSLMESIKQGRRKVFLDGGANILQGPPDSMGHLERGPLPDFYKVIFTDTGAFF